MTEIIKVSIPEDNGYSSQLDMLSRVKQHLDELPMVVSASVSGFTNPFEVDVVPPEKSPLVAAVLQTHYGFDTEIID